MGVTGGGMRANETVCEDDEGWGCGVEENDEGWGCGAEENDEGCDCDSEEEESPDAGEEPGEEEESLDPADLCLELERKCAERQRVFREQRGGIKRSFEQVKESIHVQMRKMKDQYVKLQGELQSLTTEIEEDRLEERLELLITTSSHSALPSEMQRRLAEINGRMQEDLEALTARYRTKRVKIEKEYGDEVDGMLEKQRQKRNGLDQRIKDLVEKEEQRMLSECVVCCEKVVAPNKRMLYTCGHACVCKRCFKEVWKRDKGCPLCRKYQLRQPQVIPAIIY